MCADSDILPEPAWIVSSGSSAAPSCLRAIVGVVTIRTAGLTLLVFTR
jgi:hypothetical protein